MSDITFVVEIFFSFDRANRILSPEWITERFKLFERYTLRSLLNQSFQDFRIFLLCGKRNKHITSKLSWHPKVEVYHVTGEDRLYRPKRQRPTSEVKGYRNIDSDYLSITQLGSDDLFHKDLMAEIRDSVFLDSKRSVLVVRKFIIWHTLQHYIINDGHSRTSAFITHVFPRSIYKNWKHFVTQCYLNPRVAGLDLPTTKEIGPFKICSTRHAHNISDIKNKGKKIEWRGERITDKKIITESLKDFGLGEVYET